MPKSYPDPVELFEEEEDERLTLTNELPSARRLGLRAPMAFGVAVTSGGQRVRARAAELSTTGVVLDFRHSEECAKEGLVTLELYVPGRQRPIRTAARFVRNVGKLFAFEFMIIGRDERLSIAEHIDRVRAARHERQ